MSEELEPERRAPVSRAVERSRTWQGTVIAFGGLVLMYFDKDVPGAFALACGCVMITPGVFVPLFRPILDYLPSLRK